MKAIIKRDLVHMLDDDYTLKEGDVIEVEHFSYGKFYRITVPQELSQMLVEKSQIEFIESTELPSNAGADTNNF